MTPVSSTLPVPSTTATLHPVLYPGSSPIVVLFLTGGCIKSCLVFSLKTLIESSQAFSVSSFLISLSSDGKISLVYESSAAALTSSVAAVLLLQCKS